MNIKENNTISHQDDKTEDTLSEVIELKSFSLDASEGMMCDFDTGICGPVNEEEKKEDEKMKITIWSDFVCPFCFIGQAHLDTALENFEHKDDVEIEYKSYLLMPDAEYQPGLSYYEFFADKFGMPVDKAEKQLKQQAESA